MEEIAKMSKPENLAIELLRRSVGNPRRGIAVSYNVGCPRYIEAFGTPQVHYNVSLLRCNVVVLRRGVDTIHSEQIFRFLFPKV